MGREEVMRLDEDGNRIHLVVDIDRGRSSTSLRAGDEFSIREPLGNLQRLVFVRGVEVDGPIVIEATTLDGGTRLRLRPDQVVTVHRTREAR